jgi:hypothetical protein
LAIDDRSVLGTEIDLPSRGLPYGEKLPGGVVRVNPWTTREQMLISGTNPTQSLSAINTLLDRCCPTLHEAGMKSADLITADRVFLLVMARTVSHGQSYQIRVKCSACGFQVPHTFTLPDDMEMKFLPDGWEQPFEAHLPVSKARVQLRLLRGHDDLDIERYRESLAKSADEALIGDPTYSYRMARHIVSVQFADGRIIENRTRGDMGQVNAWYLSLHAADDAEVRQVIADNDCGFDTYAELTCLRCENIFQVGLPLSVEFFRPSRKRKGSVGGTVDPFQPRAGSDVGSGGQHATVDAHVAPVAAEGTEGAGSSAAVGISGQAELAPQTNAG